ncbi:leucyl aminopeptidase [Marinicella sediminis]|uniref:Probable cytosol aminopeptidase n=1 Tax=Marinicella sediminis TaxID=1792834 RepID=A0ABV7JI27_9GAMM|nr:leucyl aminopeptidase [Marinicella sediminis]
MYIFFRAFLTAMLLTISTTQNASDHPAPALTDVQFTDQWPADGHLILGVFQEQSPTWPNTEGSTEIRLALSHALKANDFTGEWLKTQVITAPAASGLKQILLVGMGHPDDPRKPIDWQNLGGHAIQTAVNHFSAAAPMSFDVANVPSPEQVVAHLALGAKLGGYYFDRYYTDDSRLKHIEQLTVVTDDPQATHAYYAQQLNPVADAIILTRNMSNEPANVIYPESFVDQWRQHFKGLKNIKIRVYDEKDMQKQGMGALYGVGKGSARPPRMMVVEYMAGGQDEAPVVVVGKGITFDTGGISLKNPPNMWNMKFDMSGAASSMGTLYALAARGAKVNAVAIAALAENMPGPNAQRPGDVVHSLSGKTIQIRSTDAEGRLVLADGMYYADSTYDPALLVDLATLTGSVGRALGKDYAGLFTRHDDLVQPFINAGLDSGDEVWQLPLNDNHFKAIENQVADVMNSGPDAPGASAGAAFIGAFVRDTTPWVHLDIAGVAWGDKASPTHSSPGATAYGIRLLNEYIITHFENSSE